MKNKNRPVCPRCGSGQVYVNQIGIVCRRCGYRDEDKITPK